MPDDQIFRDRGVNTDLDSDCGVAEAAFPLLGMCCNKIDSLSADVYKKTCPHCSIWTSLPDGASLIVTHIFECSLYGYGRRVKE